MNDTEDTVVNPPEGRSALEKHIFGLPDDMPVADSKEPLPPYGDMPPPPTSLEETANKLRHAIEAHEAGDLETAEARYKKLLQERPNVPSAWINLGVLLRRRHKTEAAVICMRRGLALKSDDGPSWSNLGNALRDLGRYEEAIKSHNYALELQPGAALIHYNLGLVHRDLGHLSEAEDCFRRAELLGYDEADLRWDHALLHLLRGHLVEGFEGFESRWRSHNSEPRYPELPIWKGADLEGQVLLVYAEHGMGDAIQFSRYLPQLVGHAETIIFCCDSSMARLMRSSPDFDGIEILGFEEELPEDVDAVIPLLSLAKMLKTTPDNIPVKMPYLKPPKENVPILNKGNSSVLRVGVTWAGDRNHKNDHNRSINIDHFSQVLDLPGVQFYSLQKGGHEADIKTHAFDPMLRDLSPHIRDFADTASLISHLDLVISADTAVAHLSAALNIPTWILLPFAPDWRWQMVRGDSPWYPSVSLIRQTSPSDWNEVFHRVRDRLIHLLHDEADKSK